MQYQWNRADERLHAFDALRGGALLLGVAVHASMPYLPGPQIWVVRDAASPLLGVLFFTLHMFRMILFFLVAGFFGRMLVERLGSAGFARDRAKRIVLPLLVFWPPLIASIIAAFVWGAVVMNGGALPQSAAATPVLSLSTIPLAHLWFLYVLLLFYGAGLALRQVGGAHQIDIAMRAMVHLPIAAPLLALPTIAALSVKADWIAAMGIPTPDVGLVPSLAAIAGYGTAFTFGWLLNRQTNLIERFSRTWRMHIAVAVAATAALIVMLGGEVPSFAPEPNPSMRALSAVFYCVGAWCWVLGLLSAALRFLSKSNALIRYCADASYWIYLIHLPVIMAAQVALYSVPAPAAVKYIVVLTGSSIALFASYHLLVRHSWVGGWINGRKRPWKGRGRTVEVVRT